MKLAKGLSSSVQPVKGSPTKCQQFKIKKVRVVLKANKDTIGECSISKELFSEFDLTKSKCSRCRDTQVSIGKGFIRPISSRTRHKRAKVDASNMQQTPNFPCMDRETFQKLIQNARDELVKHQKREERKKFKELIKIISIPILGSKRMKDIPLLMPKNKHSHNRMLMEAIILKGKDRSLFEYLGPNVSIAKRVVEEVYKVFYKYKYKWLTFTFEEESILLQF